MVDRSGRLPTARYRIRLESTMEDALLRATGINSEVELLDGVVRIRRRIGIGFLGRAGREEKDILISEIFCIEFRKAGIISDGYIRFTYEGGGSGKGRISDMRGDDNAVFFRSSQQKAFEALRQVLEERIASRRRGSGGPGAGTDLDELEKLASLRDRGVLTEEEFNHKKRQILGL